VQYTGICPRCLQRWEKPDDPQTIEKENERC
jgi:hypothetical protein